MTSKQNTKRIFYHHVGPIHTYMRSLIDNPPKGYSFVLPDPKLNKDSSVQRASKKKWLKWFYKNIFKSLFNVFPLFMKSHHISIPNNVKLTISTGSVIEERKPWILLVLDSPFSMAGNDAAVFKQNLERITKALSSSYCKKIILHTTHSLTIMNKFFPAEVLDKTVLVHPGLPVTKTMPPKTYSSKLRLLFMGSINNPHEFYAKGGLEALETTKLLYSKGYPIELVVRCKVPEEIKEKYSFPYIKYIESSISNDELNKLYQETDLLIMPGYGGYMIMAYFDAFSRGIPIVALNTFGVSDFIENGKNGLVVAASKDALIESEDYPVNVRSSKFLKIIKNPDTKMINRIAISLQPLFNNHNLLKEMQVNAYTTFIEKFSQTRQNFELKKIFDEATNGR